MTLNENKKTNQTTHDTKTQKQPTQSLLKNNKNNKKTAKSDTHNNKRGLNGKENHCRASVSEPNFATKFLTAGTNSSA
jgi:hypothetical protein